MQGRLYRRGAEAGDQRVSHGPRSGPAVFDQSLAEKYTLSIRRNDETRTMVVRVEKKGGPACTKN